MKKLFKFFIVFFVAFNANAADTINDAWKAYGDKNYNQAINIFKSLALNGNDEAQFDLGMFYQDGKDIKQDYVEAMKWYKLAAAQATGMGVLAQFKLGEMYANGQGVKQNYVEAIKWFKLAASYDNASARINLADMYANGQGVKQDYAEAILWYKLVAVQSNPLAPIAKYKLGVIYERGNGVLQDYELAHMWWNLSAAQGYDLAKTKRDLVSLKMTSEQISRAQSLARQCEVSKYKDC